MEVAIVATIASSLATAYYTKVNSDRQKQAIKKANRAAAENARMTNARF